MYLRMDFFKRALANINLDNPHDLLFSHKVDRLSIEGDHALEMFQHVLFVASADRTFFELHSAEVLAHLKQLRYVLQVEALSERTPLVERRAIRGDR